MTWRPVPIGALDATMNRMIACLLAGCALLALSACGASPPRPCGGGGGHYDLAHLPCG